MYRSLMRVEAVDDLWVDVMIPGWNPDETVRLPRQRLPQEVRQQVVPGMRLVGDVDLSVEEKSDLRFAYETFIIAKKPDDIWRMSMARTKDDENEDYTPEEMAALEKAAEDYDCQDVLEDLKDAWEDK